MLKREIGTLSGNLRPLVLILSSIEKGASKLLEDCTNKKQEMLLKSVIKYRPGFFLNYYFIKLHYLKNRMGKKRDKTH